MVRRYVKKKINKNNKKQQNKLKSQYRKCYNNKSVSQHYRENKQKIEADA